MNSSLMNAFDYDNSTLLTNEKLSMMTVEPLARLVDKTVKEEYRDAAISSLLFVAFALSSTFETRE